MHSELKKRERERERDRLKNMQWDFEIFDSDKLCWKQLSRKLKSMFLTEGNLRGRKKKTWSYFLYFFKKNVMFPNFLPYFMCYFTPTRDAHYTLTHRICHIFLLLAEMRIPQSIVAALTHDIFINGCQVNYSMDKPTDIEVGTLYPDTPFQTIDECFKDFAGKISDISKAVDKPISNDAIIVPNSKPEALAISAAWARLMLIITFKYLCVLFFGEMVQYFMVTH